MRLTIRSVLLLMTCVVGGAALIVASANSQAQAEAKRLQAQLAANAAVLADSLQAIVEPLATTEQGEALRQVLERLEAQASFVGAAVWTREGTLLAGADNLPRDFQVPPDAVRDAIDADQRVGTFVTEGDQLRWHLQVVPLHHDQQVTGALGLLHDARGITTRRTALWRQSALSLLGLVGLLVLATWLIVRWHIFRPVAKTIEWMRRLRVGALTESEAVPKGGLFAPLAREVTQIARSLQTARDTAEEEAKLRNTGDARWTPTRLKAHLRTILKERPLLVVSNREPYTHERQGSRIQYFVPPGGLVTALEPILRACRGTWIAHGSGNADRETADASGRLAVPPDAPLYTLRRVWLTKEEEDGYYYGFANEGLWPLCHIAHTRPLFRLEHWEQYAKVNATFAQAVLEELAHTEHPCVFVQDYHFALVSKLVKAQRPDAKIALFWHIPWPNPEAFGICPWARELLQGLLGADLIGFQTQFYCNNFLDTVDRMMESRIDWEQFSITMADHATWVRPFPISIASEDGVGTTGGVATPSAPAERDRVLKSLGIDVRWLGVGVDRIDYTKGMVERFLAIERFLDQQPAFRSQFTFVELCAPSRTRIDRYQELIATLEAEVERINRRFQTRTWKPIAFLKGQHSREAIAPFYRAADVCLVTSLHDGMNLVAKEFVAARTDERGVLILSQFTGASRELRDALIVNPYDTDQMANAIHYALTMEAEEQRTRMSRMRAVVEEHNVYWWASSLITELIRLRPDVPVGAATLATPAPGA